MTTQTIEFRPPTEDVPAILLPVPNSLFAERAERFASLAAGHSLSDWLAFLGDLSRAQHLALQTLPALALPDSAAMEQARRHGMPPLHAASLARPEAWRSVLRHIADRLVPAAPAPTRTILEQLLAAPAEILEALADSLLRGRPDAADAARLPLVAAALQVVWTAMAGRLGSGHLGQLDSPGVCPGCGSLPVGSIVRLSPTVNNLRYLHCSLCNIQWNVPRAVCTACGSDQGIAYQEIEGTSGAVRAETCDACKSYLKIFYQEKDARVDPVADDLASLALDLLMDEAGYGRSGPNLLLVAGAG